MKKVVVTGGAGFIGSNLVKFLIKKKYFVINIDKLSYSGNLSSLKEFNQSKRYVFYKADLNNKTKITKILNKHKPIGIFNLAAETHVDRSIDSPDNFINNNILGTYNLLESILSYRKKNKKKIKLLHVSTDEVYGDIKIKKRSDENFPYNPSSPYSASKASADHLVKSYIKTYNLPATISKCCNNYGPYQFPEKLIPKLIYNILNNKPLPIYSKGKNLREWIHVQDHCEALLLIFLKGKIGDNYNVGTNFNLKNIDIAKKLIRIAKKKLPKIGNKVKISFVKDRPGHDFRYALDSKKIYRKLKWRNKIKFNEGLNQTFDWYLQNKNFFKKLEKEFMKRYGLKHN